MSASTPQHAVRILVVTDGAGGNIRHVVSLLADHGFHPVYCRTVYEAANILIDEPPAGPLWLIGLLPTLDRPVRQLVRQIGTSGPVGFAALVPDTPPECWLTELIEAVGDGVMLAATPHGLVDALIPKIRQWQHDIDRPQNHVAPAQRPGRTGPTRPRDLLSPDEADALLGGFKT